jgi:glyoxylase-like metal-dependent hydrolase (beta-lactamase superfamily II)
VSVPAPQVESFTVGRLKVHAIQAGGQRLDGGAMFGVVPKPLWERRIQADERNRIQLGMRCLLVEHERGLVLIDNGAGNKENQKFHDIYGVENTGTGGRTLLEDGLRSLGVNPGEIVLMIDTHLHFDHAGGNTFVNAEGTIAPTFPNARYVVQRGEYEWATHTNERTAASYFAHNFEPVVAAGLFDFANGETEVWPGIRLIPTPGHTPHHQSILLESDGAKVFYPADLSPTASHIPLPWIMGYDVEPLRTLETKKVMWRRAVDEEWLLLFEHDAFVTSGRIEADGKGFGFRADGPTGKRASG